MEPAAITYAGFWKRFAAYLLDTVLITCASFFLIVPLLGVFGLGVATTAMDNDPDDVIAVIIAAVIAYAFVSLLIFAGTWLYFALMESSAKQATLGKLAVGIVVTDLDGRRLSFGRATGRYFAKILSSLTFGIGYLLAGFTEKKQALHDMVASCLVVNK